MSIVELHNLGVVSYADGLAIQQRLVERVQNATGAESLMLLEHHPVITMGRGTRDGHLLKDSEWLARHGVEVFESGRGGDITYHGPGQIVGYPILDLARRCRDLHVYLRNLEELIIRLVGEFEISAGRIDGLTGVWVNGSPPRKIAAIGIRVQRWVTSHGFALNVSGDLSGFGYIIPCGLESMAVTSMERETASAPDMADVRSRLARRFEEVFGLELNR